MQGGALGEALRARHSAQKVAALQAALDGPIRLLRPVCQQAAVAVTRRYCELAEAVAAGIDETRDHLAHKEQRRLDRLARAQSGFTAAEEARLALLQAPVEAMVARGCDEVLVRAVLKDLAPAACRDLDQLLDRVQKRDAKFHSEIVAAVKDTVVCGEVPNIPLSYLRRWTDGFSEQKCIGRGGNGLVFEGVFSDGRVAGRVAVKCITLARVPLKEAGQRADVLARINREVAILQSFRHPNIIRLVGLHLPGLQARQTEAGLGRVALVYELATKGSLLDCLADPLRAAELDWRRRVQVLHGVASALNYMHCRDPAQPAFHRDVKSANIALTDALAAKLIDCGLAKQQPPGDAAADFTQMSRTGQLFFSPGYACPQYLGGQPYDAACEVFTGKAQRPGLHDGDSDTVAAMAADQRAGEWSPAVVAALRELVGGCLQKHSRRIPTVVLVLRRLTAVLREHCSWSAAELRMEQELARLRASLDCAEAAAGGRENASSAAAAARRLPRSTSTGKAAAAAVVGPGLSVAHCMPASTPQQGVLRRQRGPPVLGGVPRPLQGARQPRGLRAVPALGRARGRVLLGQGRRDPLRRRGAGAVPAGL